MGRDRAVGAEGDPVALKDFETQFMRK